MVKNLLIIIATSSVLFTGCVSTSQQDTEADNSKIQKVNKRDYVSADERKIMYKGDYNIQYKEPRVVWFKPMLTSKGNVVSERTVALAPKDMRWSQEEEKTSVGQKFIELTKDTKK